MVLHTDHDHPHVHLVLKATSEDGVRLNIRKATLREWRRDFAAALRMHGVAANATERAVRGAVRSHKTDGIYRAMRRGESTHYEERTLAVARELRGGQLNPGPGKDKLLGTRRDVERGWRAVSHLLEREGDTALALQVRRFVDRMLPPQTEREWIAGRMLGKFEIASMSAPGHPTGHSDVRAETVFIGVTLNECLSASMLLPLVAAAATSCCVRLQQHA
jgi:hypothetical protein